MAKFNNRRKINVKQARLERYSFKEVSLTKIAKRQLLVTLLSILGVTIVSLGSAFAVFTSISRSSDYNIVKAGTLNIDFGEDSNNTIDLNGQYPVSDEVGLTYTPYTFTITNVGSLAAQYDIFIHDDTDMISQDNCTNNQLSKDYIKYSLDGKTSLVLSSIKDSNYRIDSGTLESGASKTITLYVWIKEGVGNDVLNKHYHGKIVVNGRSGDTDLSQVALKILTDNPVKDTVDGMFTYTNEGRQETNGEVNSTYVTNGIYMMEDEDGESYYFRGNVNNILQFGTYETDYYVYRYNNQDFQTLESCQASNSSCSESNKVLKYSKGTPMYWRIVRVNGDGTLRLLYSGTSKDATENDLMIGYSKYNLSFNDKKYTGYTYDNGTDSLVKKEVDEWYKNAFSTSSYDKYIASGRFCSDSSGYGNSAYDNDYTTFFASYDRLSAGNPTLICPETTETFGGSYRLKAGLMTADEMVLGGDKIYVTSNNYLSSGTADYWTMSPAVFVNYMADIWYRGSFLHYSIVGNSLVRARPVINVDVTNLTLTGFGSLETPYVLSEN